MTRQTSVSVTIASGASLSAAVHLAAGMLLGVILPAVWTAANLTLQASADGVTYADVYDKAGNEVTITAAASRCITLDPWDFAGVRYLKIRSGTASVPVNQAADRSLTLLVGR